MPSALLVVLLLQTISVIPAFDYISNVLSFVKKEFSKSEGFTKSPLGSCDLTDLAVEEEHGNGKSKSIYRCFSVKDPTKSVLVKYQRDSALLRSEGVGLLSFARYTPELVPKVYHYNALSHLPITTLNPYIHTYTHLYTPIHPYTLLYTLFKVTTPSSPAAIAAAAAAANVHYSEITTYFPYNSLLYPGPYPAGVRVCCRELYLNDEEFKTVLGCAKEDWVKTIPAWRKVDKKKKSKLF